MFSRALIALSAVALFMTSAFGMDSALHGKLEARVKDIQSWAADPAVVAAVKAQNGAKSADAQAMTQDKWKSLTVLDPFVRSLSKNAAAEVLKAHKTDEVSEAFISSSDGTKVAFLSKTTSWNHKGKAKHDVPMSGKVWTSDVEVDESTGLQQVQIAVPVLDGGKPIGSLVVGLSLSKLGG